MSFKKKLKLLLTKEEGKMSKMNIALGSIVFFSLDSFSYSLNKQLFDITEPSNVQHLHNVIIKINETEPTDITFNYQKKESCLIVTLISLTSYHDYIWKDITGEFKNEVESRCYVGRTSGFSIFDYQCDYNNNQNKKTCWIKTSDLGCDSFGFVKYEYYNKTSFDSCNSNRNIFYTDVYKAGGLSIVNTWKNII